jgi:hypothetical protein
MTTLSELIADLDAVALLLVTDVAAALVSAGKDSADIALSAGAAHIVQRSYVAGCCEDLLYHELLRYDDKLPERAVTRFWTILKENPRENLFNKRLQYVVCHCTWLTTE